MTAYTPGPWHVHAKEPNVIMASHCMIAECGDTTPEDRANARLIAAAPDLLEALRALHRLIHDHKDDWHGPSGFDPATGTDPLGRAWLAIRKADGV